MRYSEKGAICRTFCLYNQPNGGIPLVTAYAIPYFKYFTTVTSPHLVPLTLDRNDQQSSQLLPSTTSSHVFANSSLVTFLWNIARDKDTFDGDAVLINMMMDDNRVDVLLSCEQIQ